MDSYLSIFSAFLLTHSLATMSPGPDFIVVAKHSLQYSRRIGIYCALGVSLGFFLHLSYSILGVGVLIQNSVIAFTILKYGGAGYLIYLGIKSLLQKSAQQDLLTSVSPVVSNSTTRLQAVSSGFFVNALNPKCALFFISLYAVLIPPATPYFLQFGLALATFFIAFIWFIFISVVFTADASKTFYRKYDRYINYFFGVVLCSMGGYIAFFV